MHDYIISEAPVSFTASQGQQMTTTERPRRGPQKIGVKRTFILPEDLYAQADLTAHAEGTTVSDIVRRALREYLKDYAPQSR